MQAEADRRGTEIAALYKDDLQALVHLCKQDLALREHEFLTDLDRIHAEHRALFKTRYRKRNLGKTEEARKWHRDIVEEGSYKYEGTPPRITVTKAAAGLRLLHMREKSALLVRYQREEAELRVRFADMNGFDRLEAFSGCYDDKFWL